MVQCMGRHIFFRLTGRIGFIATHPSDNHPLATPTPRSRPTAAPTSPFGPLERFVASVASALLRIRTRALLGFRLLVLRLASCTAPQTAKVGEKNLRRLAPHSVVLVPRISLQGVEFERVGPHQVREVVQILGRAQTDHGGLYCGIPSERRLEVGDGVEGAGFDVFQGRRVRY